jgi:hypothetical protein
VDGKRHGVRLAARPFPYIRSCSRVGFAVTETTGGDSPEETPAPPAEPTPEVAPAPPTEPSAQAAAPAPDTSSPAKSAEERKANLDRRLSQSASQGWRIENRSDFQATIAKGKPIHHILHLILTIITAGLWAIVWILLAIFGGVKRRLLTIDEFGNISDAKI